MSEYITEEGKINDVDTVKAQADQTPAACSCACLQDLHNYVLTVDFVNALQNIRAMIHDALTNIDLTDIYRQLLLEINARLMDVWKHVGLIEDESNQQSVVKQKLLNLPQSELRQGDTRVLTYAKTIEGETESRQINDLYVYLGQSNGLGATIDESVETNEHISKKWVKIMTMDFTMDPGQDINIDDLIRRLKKLEDSIDEIVRVVTSIWAYLCKNWWEFVDTIDTVNELASKTDMVIAQNYYCKEDHNIYIYLRTGGTQDEPVMQWIPLLNADNMGTVWRHVEVVSSKPTATGNEAVGETKYNVGDHNIYVWLPTALGEHNCMWIPILNADNMPNYQTAWRHTKVVSETPNEGSGDNGAGTFVGETRFSTSEEIIIDKPHGDVYVWLPTDASNTKHWINITRNREINSISNYLPENLVIIPHRSQFSSRFKDACTKGYYSENIKIERFGQLVSIKLYMEQGPGDADPSKNIGQHHKAYNPNTNGTQTLGFTQGDSNTGANGWVYLKGAMQYWFMNRNIGDVMRDENRYPNAYRTSTYVWFADDQNFYDGFSYFNIIYLLDKIADGETTDLPRVTIDGNLASKGDLLRLCDKYLIPQQYDDKKRLRILMAKFFCPTVDVSLQGYGEYVWTESIHNDKTIASIPSGSTEGLYLPAAMRLPRDQKYNHAYEKSSGVDTIKCGLNNMFDSMLTKLNPPSAGDFNPYKLITTTDSFKLDSVDSGVDATAMDGDAGTPSVTILPTGWVLSPVFPINMTPGNYSTYRPYLTDIYGTYVGRNLSLDISNEINVDSLSTR